MTERSDWRISYLRAFACIAIIILHTFYIANITFTESYGIAGNIISNTIRNLMLWAVPNFVMITGALLLDPYKKITIKKIFSKYIRRIFLALLIFCIIYQVFDSILIDHNFGIGSFLTGIKETLLGTSWSTNWYLYTLISLYLLLPFYRMVAERIQPGEMRYLLLVYAVFLSILPILRIWNIRLGFTINVSTIYPFYLFMGHAIYTGKVRISRRTGFYLIIVGSLLTILLTAIRYAADIETLEMFRDYNGINVIIQAVGVFAYVMGADNTQDNYSGDRMSATFGRDARTYNPGKNSLRSNQLVNRALISLDENSFGIYLIHIIFIKWMFRVVNFDPYAHGGFAGFFIFIVIIILNLFLSWVITFALRKIPGVKSVL